MTRNERLVGAHRENSSIVEETHQTLGYLRRLIRLFETALSKDGKQESPPLNTGGDIRDKPSSHPALHTLENDNVKEAVQHARALINKLKEANWGDRESNPIARELRIANILVLDGLVPIRNGLLERYRFEGLVTQQEITVTFYLTVKGINDVLIRETHGPVGWHYHYCKRNGERSDTILAFDAVAVQKPLFWERHGEGKAKFQARADRWRDRKRRNVYDACEPDVLVRAPGEFRRPSKEAVRVWPLQ